jgi:outer membrane lipoprotein-sorting protein
MDHGPWKKWTPAVAVTAMIAALAAGGSITASARTDLPDRTPQDVLEMVASHELEGYSGHLEASVELGLPQLSVDDVQDSGAEDAPTMDGRLAELLSMLPGTHEARVFADGHDRLRLQVLDGADEKNLIRNDDDLWFYDSAENQAVHATLPRQGARHGEAMDQWHRGAAMPTPERMAERLLDKAEEHSVVSVEEGTGDSGRSAYTLRLDPRTEQTLVDGVSVEVDAQTGMPLGVEVRAVGQDEPAVSVAFTEFTPEVPDAGLFDFQPPAGAAVVEESLPDCGMWHGDAGAWQKGARGSGPAGHRDGEVVGDGWNAVVVIPADSSPGELADSALLDGLAVDVEDGRVLSTPLLNVLLTDDGRVLAGSVPQQRLLEVAAAGTGEE